MKSLQHYFLSVHNQIRSDFYTTTVFIYDSSSKNNKTKKAQHLPEVYIIFRYYHNGNSDPCGYCHISIMVPDVGKACARCKRQINV